MGSSITIGLAVVGDADGTSVREESAWPPVIVVSESFVIGEAVASTNSETGLSDPGTKNIGASVVGALGSKEGFVVGFPVSSGMTNLLVGTKVGLTVGSVVRGTRNPPKFVRVGL